MCRSSAEHYKTLHQGDSKAESFRSGPAGAAHVTLVHGCPKVVGGVLVVQCEDTQVELHAVHEKRLLDQALRRGVGHITSWALNTFQPLDFVITN